ncbi:MAG: aldehyde dehydrogenase family protein, partial [Nitrospirota bacterium]
MPKKIKTYNPAARSLTPYAVPPCAAQNYINGQWVDAIGKKTFSSENPADGRDVIGVVPDSDQRDVNVAVRAAKAAFPKWSSLSAPKRGEILYRAAELLVKHKQQLGEMVTREMGKILPEGLGDVQEAIDMTYYMAGEGRRLSGETVASELANKDAKSVRVGIGVFGLITPWNFPIAIPSWKITPALIAGNTIVFKPAEETPVCATRFVQILEEAGLPPGVLNLVHGQGETVGEPIVRHPDVNAVAFTGSNAVGSKLAEICGSLQKPFMMETGGKNPIVIMDDANLDLAVEGAIWGGFGTSGQRCTAASRLIVHEKIYDRFVKKFKERASLLVLGNGLDQKTNMGPIVSPAQYQKVLDYIEIGKNEGARLILGGTPYKKKGTSSGHFISPTIFVDVTPSMRIAQEEIFGPVVVILRAKNLTQAIAMANDSPFGLSAAIYSQDVNKT